MFLMAQALIIEIPPVALNAKSNRTSYDAMVLAYKLHKFILKQFNGLSGMIRTVNPVVWDFGVADAFINTLVCEFAAPSSSAHPYDQTFVDPGEADLREGASAATNGDDAVGMRHD